MYKSALIYGGVFALIAIIIGAFGAHVLKLYINQDQLNTLETGVKYQMYHAIALILIGMVYRSFPFKQFKIATALFILGILLFSGSIYAITALRIAGDVGIGRMGFITPLGGTCFMAGWVSFILGLTLNKEQNAPRRSSKS